VDEPKRHVLVDGHNVLHAWGWYNREAAGAPERLAEELRVLHDTGGLDVTVVFDGRGHTSSSDPVATTEGFTVRYASAGLTADGEIERLAAQGENPRRCVVVTGDVTVRGNVMAAGGDALTPAELRAWIDRIRGRARRALHTQNAQRDPSFGNKLPL
jgi:predicted RNA-binding protein with PIN domain